jgi:hypothetical protein
MNECQWHYLQTRYQDEYESRTGTPPPVDSIAVWEDALQDRLCLLAEAAT